MMNYFRLLLAVFFFMNISECKAMDKGSRSVNHSMVSPSPGYARKKFENVVLEMRKNKLELVKAIERAQDSGDYFVVLAKIIKQREVLLLEDLYWEINNNPKTIHFHTRECSILEEQIRAYQCNAIPDIKGLNALARIGHLIRQLECMKRPTVRLYDGPWMSDLSYF